MCISALGAAWYIFVNCFIQHMTYETPIFWMRFIFRVTCSIATAENKHSPNSHHTQGARIQRARSNSLKFKYVITCISQICPNTLRAHVVWWRANKSRLLCRLHNSCVLQWQKIHLHRSLWCTYTMTFRLIKMKLLIYLQSCIQGECS